MPKNTTKARKKSRTGENEDRNIIKILKLNEIHKGTCNYEKRSRNIATGTWIGRREDAIR